MTENQNKIQYHLIFIVVTYKNADDINMFYENLEQTLKNTSYLVVNVDNYYSETVSALIKQITLSHGGIYIGSANRGYGAGNNLGIQYAVDNCSFRYICISNPDVITGNIDMLKGITLKKCILAPDIITLKGKKQNPYKTMHIKMVDVLWYYGLQHDSPFVFKLGSLINRLVREVFCLIRNNKLHKIYAPHGSCFFLDYSAVKELHPIYDEKMFLYAEEDLLAHKAKNKKINIYYCPFLKAVHKEDGSIGHDQFRVKMHSKNSFIYFYEKYVLPMKD